MVNVVIGQGRDGVADESSVAGAAQRDDPGGIGAAPPKGHVAQQGQGGMTEHDVSVVRCVGPAALHLPAANPRQTLVTVEG